MLPARVSGPARTLKKEDACVRRRVHAAGQIGLHKWVLAAHLFAASKKGISSKQIQRMLSVTYKSAWFMTMRLREASKDKYPSPIGGAGKIVESDETFVGGKKKNVSEIAGGPGRGSGGRCRPL